MAAAPGSPLASFVKGNASGMLNLVSRLPLLPVSLSCVDGAYLSGGLFLSRRSAVQSSKHSLHSWNAEEVGSTNELIQLGDSARTFTAKQEGEAPPPSTSHFCQLMTLTAKWRNHPPPSG